MRPWFQTETCHMRLNWVKMAKKWTESFHMRLNWEKIVKKWTESFDMRRICDKFEKKMTKCFHMHRMNRREENVRCYSRLHWLEGKGLSYAINERKKNKKKQFYFICVQLFTRHKISRKNENSYTMVHCSSTMNLSHTNCIRTWIEHGQVDGHQKESTFSIQHTRKSRGFLDDQP